MEHKGWEDTKGKLCFGLIVPDLSPHIQVPCSLNYLIRKGGKTTFYACDTGLFFPESLEYLKNFHIDTLVIEFTFGLSSLPRDAKHLTLETLKETLEALKAQGTIDDATEILATHIGHKGGLLHEACNEALQSIWNGNIQAAYDGLRI